MTKNNFPKDFLWGSAAAAYHFEGAWDKDGKGPAVFDVVPTTQDKRTDKPEPGNLKHRAVEFYDRYKEDVKLFGELGLKSFRTSISWSRIYPRGIEDTPNEKGLEFYDNLFDELHKYGIEPIVTITHSGEMPLYLADNYNGFANKEVIDYYEKYVETIVKRYKNKVKYWLTFNEINGTENMPFFYGGVSQDKESISEEEMRQIYFNIFLASAKATKIIHEIDPNAMVGCSTIQGPYYPLTPKPEDYLSSYIDNRNRLAFIHVQAKGEYPSFKVHEFKEKGIHLDASKSEWEIIKENTVDYIAYSYYLSGVSEANQTAEEKMSDVVNVISDKPNPYLNQNEWGWSIDPIGLRTTLNVINDLYGLPQFIVENGHSQLEELEKDENGNLTVLDDARIVTLRDHLLQVNEALNDGVEVIGYTNWAVMDFISGTTGTMRKRWGFIYVDWSDEQNGTMKRYKKKSFKWYHDVIESNGDLLFE
ncbi:glycoside hydrolase family 1 protein [Aerococcus tenax]|uniref:glycoside hydrolase family 1 protein n=1 Tax=Aerococcus tenax TaxID=3078812 RepID=UPI0018A6EBA1|nr:glycoside hydrolase family 1 protein [Aerococcus tenax]